MLKNLKDLEVKNKRVLLRVDYNVSISENGEILDDFRIKKTIPTIKYLKEQDAKIIILSHFGRPEGKFVAKYSLKMVFQKLKEILQENVFFLDDCLGKKVERRVKEMKPGEIFLLENLRFYKGEEDGDPGFAKKLARLGEVFVNDAFAACHRVHTSISILPQILPSAAGFLLEEEVNTLTKIIEKPKRPLVAIIGGTKLETKIELIERLIKKADHLILGSKPTECIFFVKGLLPGRQFDDIENELLERIKKIDLTNKKIHLPVDGQIALSAFKEEKYLRKGAIGSLRKEEDIYDIGPETVKIFNKVIKTGKTIVWNGPVGMFEKKPFDMGTREIVNAIVRNHSSFKVAGGGETITIISQLKMMDKFDFVSTGGGAMLEFLAGKKLPGIEVLKNNL